MPKLVRRIEDKLARVLGDTREACWIGEQPVASFTFDDFPRSAWTAGGAILERHGGHGTYYACLGHLRRPPEAGFFTADDLAALIERGHELGCHTFSHTLAHQASRSQFVGDLERNAAELSRLRPDVSFANFAYPGGQDPPRAARESLRRFASARGIAPGVHEGRFRVNRLRANRIYSNRTELGAVRKLVDENASRSGWLVFYTHDVQPDPGDFGCTPELFEAVVRMTVESGARILTVAEALGSPAVSRTE